MKVFLRKLFHVIKKQKNKTEMCVFSVWRGIRQLSKKKTLLLSED